MNSEQLWRNLLPVEILEKADRLLARAQRERDEGHIVFPAQDRIFQALKLTAPAQVRVVILGQDPYYIPGAANGLAFSVGPEVKIPASLRNIYRELCEDIGCPVPGNGDLSPWARQGVLLLNTVLTVEEGHPTSHKDWGWQEIVAALLRICAVQLPQPVVFLLWGRYAQSFAGDPELRARPDRAWLASSHPSPLGARKASGEIPAFLGSRPFSRANRFLQEQGAQPVDWALPS